MIDFMVRGIRSDIFRCTMNLVVLHMPIDLVDKMSFLQFLQMKQFVMLVVFQFENLNKN